MTRLVEYAAEAADIALLDISLYGGLCVFMYVCIAYVLYCLSTSGMLVGLSFSISHDFCSAIHCSSC